MAVYQYPTDLKVKDTFPPELISKSIPQDFLSNFLADCGFDIYMGHPTNQGGFYVANPREDLLLFLYPASRPNAATGRAERHFVLSVPFHYPGPRAEVVGLEDIFIDDLGPHGEFNRDASAFTYSFDIGK